MFKKFFAILSVFSLILTLVPASEPAKAAIQSVGFEVVSASSFEGNLVYVNFQILNTISESDYIDLQYTIGGTANSSDYYFNDSSGTVRLKKDQLSFPLYGIDEGGLELDETLIITINSAVNKNGQVISVDQNKKVYTHTIRDYNGPPKLSFLYSDDSSDENGSQGTFTVYLSRASASNVDFNWTFISGLSTAIDHATVLNGNTFSPDVLVRSDVVHSETIPAGQVSIDIPLGIQDDNLFEGNETVTLNLGNNPAHAVLGSMTAQTYTIIDNDDPSISFQLAGSSGQESIIAPTMTVVLTKALQHNLTFSLVVDQVHSSARWGGVDWNLPVLVAPLTIQAGATSVNVGITVVDDNDQESAEEAVFSITNMVVQGNSEIVGFGSNPSYTYTITDNDTPAPIVPPVVPPVVPPGGGNGGGGGTTVPNNGVCPVLNPGDMIKVAGNPAIYVVNRFNKIMYFPSGDEYKSWNEGEGYGGYITVTQNCFDNGLQVPSGPPAGVNYRSGSYIIQKENTSQLYAVLPNNTIAKISTADAQALYGTNYKVMTVKFIFWSNYINTASEISGKAHSGMLVRKDNKVWYVDGNNLREVPVNQMSVNRFKSAFVHTVPASYLTGFGTGAPIDGEVTSLTNRTQL